MIAEPLLRIDLVIFRLATDHDRGVPVRVLILRVAGISNRGDFASECKASALVSVFDRAALAAVVAK